MPETTYHIDYTLIICTHNPDEGLLKRCLTAIEKLVTRTLRYEILLIDNNCTPPLLSKEIIKTFLTQVSVAKCILEERQGLSHARLAGIKHARGRYLIFFDDDNEPDPYYLKNMAELHSVYPAVGAWGPGQISVDFIDGIAEQLKEFAEAAFQQRNDNQVAFSDQHQWMPCYPYGTGLSIRTDIARQYAEKVNTGQFSLTGRNGKKLSSGEDTQMVLFTISMGYQAGISPSLRLTHMITQKKANLTYLKRLTYGTAFCYATCVSEVFPSEKERIRKSVLSRAKLFRKTIKWYWRATYSQNPIKSLKIIHDLSSIIGNYHAVKKTIPRFTTWVLRRLKAF